MSNDRNKGLRYTRISYEDIERLLQVFSGRFDEILALKGFPRETGKHISNFTLIDIIVRVDKRKAYYQCFHGMEINECKEAALYAYWILKLRPFVITDTKYSKTTDACHINELFVIYFIGLVLESTGRIKQTTAIKDSYSRFLEYSFRFRSFSIDSFLVLIESISTETLEKEYPDLTERV
ncbi:MAG: hypothetical protein LBI85_08540 [Spirochaetaceae bacterium]|jgi:hypothetical protein|nr:hypothetical protein [Spirochaetaceae bacterium]